ncbi:thiol reductant ABC exporter subunit CydD [Lactococcus termiticola]|uniref:Cytochrome bd biosynthesis ABC transporter ATP-binding and permease components cydD n=1 Tax=Lactococcus termiticola TaxID=2169526 RepID=A0A2R5HEE1_9LACT|nr:thiol reductant ABC exporter subunit CydD [Lactococcus termiticola]GBG96443.1 cytochrome bd biosynthesis ABC transporter ATP-binding and permease components cydD [Lactococcus termiticola]
MIDRELMQLPAIKRILPLLGILAVFQGLVISGQALFLSGAITGLWKKQTLGSVALLILGFFVCYMVRELISYLRLKFLDKFAYQMAMDYRLQLLEKSFELGPSLVSEMGSGNLISTAIAGIENVETYIKLVLSKILNMMIVPIVLVVVVFFLDWESSIVLIVAFPFAIIFMILLGYAAQGRAERQYKTFTMLSNHFLDALRGLPTLKYFGLSKSYASAIYSTSERFRKATMSTLSMAMLSTFALDFFATLSVATVALFLGLRLINGHILLFPALAALILAPEYFLPLREFASDYHATLDGKNAMDAVKEVLAKERDKSAEDAGITEKVSWSDESKLTLKSLTKTYETGRGVADVSLDLQGFQKVALVGASGSGKSTLLSMLAGFLDPTSGSLKINDQAVSSLMTDNWRQSLSLIPQQSYIFAATLRENIAFYEPEAEETAILEAAKLAGLSGLVDEIGLDAQIGAAGRTISGGQAQRVALARAFLSSERNILLLDEPTAHLDIETELEIKENILPLLDKKLVFLATHRLHWLPQMDLVVVLDEGQVAGIGSHEELLATNSYYQKLLAEMRG